jgi:hypothetical protein
LLEIDVLFVYNYRVNERLTRNQETRLQIYQLENETSDFDELADAVTPLWRVSLSHVLKCKIKKLIISEISHTDTLH